MKTQNTADSLIAQQIASLDVLPAGYTPNLESKWQLLETTLVEQRKSKRKIIVILRAAAALVLMAALSLLYTTFNKSTTSTIQVISQNNTRMLVTPANKSLQAVISPIEKNAVYVKQASTKQKTVILTPEEAPTIMPEQEFRPLTAENYASVDTMQTIVAETKTRKKSKTRYIQMDFGEQNDIAQNKQKQALHTTGLQFKLAPTTRSSEPEARETKQNKSLRINF